MPNNWDQPTHTVPAHILDSGEWPPEVGKKLMRNRVADPGSYRRWLEPGSVDIWETVYHQELIGKDPVLTWVKGSVLRPVMDAMAPSDADRFVERCRAMYAQSYPPTEHGITMLPFRRLFIVATAK
jgi:trans-aconitate 2-methyltransferase